MKSKFAFVFFQNSKVRRFAFELKMQDKSTFLLAADSEAEMEEWIGTLNKILHSSFEQAMQEKRNGDLHDGVFSCIFSLSLTSCVCLSSLIIFACIHLSALQCSCPHLLVAISFDACCTCGLLQFACTSWSNSSLGCKKNNPCLTNHCIISYVILHSAS